MGSRGHCLGRKQHQHLRIGDGFQRCCSCVLGPTRGRAYRLPEAQSIRLRFLMTCHVTNLVPTSPASSAHTFWSTQDCIPLSTIPNSRQ